MGANTGGGGNYNPYSSCTVIPYEGLINENYFKIKQKETELSANLEIFKYISKNPFNKKLDYFLGLFIKSKYDGIGRELDTIDISIALDISGSMNSSINQKPTFKELALKIENEKNGNPNIHNDNNNNNIPKKDRLTIAKECLFKMINSMNDKVQMALTTFDVESKLVITLSPKEELKSISNKINNIKAGGGTDLTKALEGAAECLNESTAKFKRVIIITDGWDNKNTFMDLARKLNEKDILITVISIDSSSNSSLYDKLSELKGCNYYFILNEKDMEKYLIQQFNYICFPILYDLKINFKSEDADLIRTIGCGEKNETTEQKNETIKPNRELTNIKSLFPSDIKEYKGNFYQEGGLILLKIKPKSLEKNCKIELNLEYTEIEGNKFEKKFEIEYNVDEMKNGVEENEIKKGIACYYYNKFYRKMAKFLNKSTTIDCGGPHENLNMDKPDKKYFDFLSRNNENYDMVKIYFTDNYENDLNEYQKEYYLKNLDKFYDKVLTKMNNYQNNQ